jgi:Leucine-rich repeat (LRR) protein
MLRQLKFPMRKVCMLISRSLTGAAALVLLSQAQGAYAQTPLPQVFDPGLQSCISETAAQNGWQYAEQVTSLSCVARGIVQVGGLQTLVNLAQLNLANNQLIDVSGLFPLTNLTSLNLAGNGALFGQSVLPLLVNQANLTALNLNGVNVGSLSSLNNLINPRTGQPFALVELDLGNTRYRDAQNGNSIDFVRSMPTLKKLGMAGNNLTNIDAIGNLPQLEELDLSNNRVPYLGYFPATGLKRLNLSGNRQMPVQEIARVIAQNPGLMGLKLNGVPIGDISNLGPLVDSRSGAPLNLQELDLGNTGLKDRGGANADAGFLRAFPNLKQLNLANLGLIEVYVLSSLLQVEQLDLSGNNLQSVASLGQMHNLMGLNLSGNRSLRFDEVYNAVLVGNPKLSSIGLSGINIGHNGNLLFSLTANPEQSRNMAELDLGNTALDDSGLNLLGAFPNLRKLNLAANSFSMYADFNVLRNAVHLQELDLSDNRLRDAYVLANLHELTRLNLNRTGLRIDDVRPMLNQNMNLTSIKLSGMAIGQFSNLGSLRNYQTGQTYNLTELDLSYTGLLGNSGGNRGFDFLSQLPNMQRLNLAGNAIEDVYEYRDMVFLTEFDVSNNQLQYLPPLADPSQLTRLNLSGNPKLNRYEVANWLGRSPLLNSIGLNGIKFAALSELGPLTDPRTGRPLDLIELDLGNTGLTDGNGGVGFLAPFLNLQKLNLANNGVQEVSGLFGMGQLTELDLSDNPLVTLGNLVQSRRLIRLNLSGSRNVPEPEVAALVQANPNLNRIGLNGINLGRFSNLLNTLRNNPAQALGMLELDLGNTQLNPDSLYALGSMPNLQRLNLSGNNLSGQQINFSIGSSLNNVGELDLSNNPIGDTAYFVNGIHNLTRLNLANTQMRSDDVRLLLDHNPNLVALNLNGVTIGQVSNLPALTYGQLAALTELDLGNTGLKGSSGSSGFDFLFRFPGLTRLNLAGNGITALGELQAMPNLLELDLANNQLVNLPFLFNTSRLQRLNLSGNRQLVASDIAILISRNPGLTRLGVNGIAVGQISNLGSLLDARSNRPLDLLELDLGNTGLLDSSGQKDLAFLQAYPNLQRLNLAGNGLNSIAPLASLLQLRELDLSGNAVFDINALNGLRNLSRLNLSGNSAIDASVLRAVLERNPNLSAIGLNGIALGDFSALGLLQNPQNGRPYNLIELDLGNTRLSAQGNSTPLRLAAFPNLQRVNLAGNGLTSLTGMDLLTQVTELDVSNNNLADLRSMGGLTGLTVLNLSGNPALPSWQLSNPIRQNPGLIRLGLNGIALNSLADVNGLNSNYAPLKLLELDLGNTHALDLDGLNFLSGFPNLTRLNLAGNGLRNISGIRILSNFGQLADLDLSNNAVPFAGDLFGMQFLKTVNLSGNAALRCFDLDILVTSLPATQITRPTPCAPDNQPPVADAGANQSVESGDNVQLNGIVSDSDGAIGNVTWVQTAGPSVVLNTSAPALANFVAPVVSLDTVFSFQLNVQDNKGASASSSTNVTVKAKANALPVANPGVDQTVTSGGNVTLTGSGTDSDGSIVSYAWLQTAGPAVTLANPASASTGFTAPVVLLDTVFTFQLSVQDDKGATASSSVSITVKPAPNQPPVAQAGAYQTVASGAAVTLSGTATDSDGSIASYVWLQTAGPTVTLSNANTANASFTAPLFALDTGLTFQLTVQDNKGASAVSSTIVTVKAKPNAPPVANAGAAQTVASGAAVTLAGSATDSDGSIASYGWLQTAGPGVTLSNANSANPAFTAPLVAVDTVLTFQLTAQDDKGATGNSSVSITVKAKPNVAPVANAGPAQTVASGASVSLTGNGTDSDGSIASYAWLQSAGPAVTLANPASAATGFTAPVVAVDTVLTFQLTVKDDKGAAASSSVAITVKAVPNVAPSVNAGASQSVNEGASVALSGSGSDSDGSIASYRWVQTAGPAVGLVNANTAVASFVAPQVTGDTILSFKLTVVDNRGASAVASTNVTVKDTADLVVTGITTPTGSVNRGASFSVTVSTKNGGSRASSIATTTGLYLTTSATSVGTGNTRIGSASVSGTLGAGSTSTATVTVTVPSTLAAGTYYIGGIADYAGKLSEGNESNNSLVGPTLTVK